MIDNVAIIDLMTAEMNGLQLTRQLLQAVPRVAVLIFSTHDDKQLALGDRHSGAKGYLLKTATGPELLQAVTVLHQGKSCFLTIPKSRGLVAPVSILSLREREVVQLLAAGLTSKEAAAHLGISPRTVESHRTAIMEKLKLSSLAALVRFAIRHGLAPS